MGESAAKGPPFSRVWATVNRAAASSGLTMADYCVLVCLMAFQGEDGTLSRPSEKVARELGLNPGSVRRCMARLTREEFAGPDGQRMPFLTRTRKAAPGRCAAYRLNVPREPWW